MKSPHLLLKTLAFAVTLATGCVAQAAPYAYAEIAFTNLTLSGLNAPGIVIGGATVTTSSSANYPLYVSNATSAGGSLTTGSDTLQSTSGPGVFPGQNVFTQALLGSYGTRGDALTTGNLLTGTPAVTAKAVAEGRLAPLGVATSAASAGGTSTGFSFNFTANAPTTLKLSFTAQDLLSAMTTALGDGASAEVNSSFTIRGGSFFDIFSPADLNASVSSTSGTGDHSVSSGPIAYSHDFVLGAGSYQFSFLTGTQQRLEAARVPEPAPLALVSLGLLALAAAKGRKKNIGSN